MGHPGERDQALDARVGTADSPEAPSEDGAVEVGAKLAFDEGKRPWPWALRSGMEARNGSSRSWTTWWRRVLSGSRRRSSPSGA
jgi:hypothetical protein